MINVACWLQKLKLQSHDFFNNIPAATAHHMYTEQYSDFMDKISK